MGLPIPSPILQMSATPSPGIDTAGQFLLSCEGQVPFFLADNISLKCHGTLSEGWPPKQRGKRGLLRREECVQLPFLSPSPMGRREEKAEESGHECHLSSSLTGYHEVKDMGVAAHPNQA